MPAATPSADLPMPSAPLLAQLAALPDPRIDRAKRHSLTDVLAIALLATLRRWALSLMRQDTTQKTGLKGRRLIAGWDPDYLLHLLHLAVPAPDTISQCVSPAFGILLLSRCGPVNQASSVPNGESEITTLRRALSADRPWKRAAQE